uniref:Uncharacterized protein n=1 Tax=viral metagenome TaxID=1070528 RepID=A0A6C0KF36_9ZZZZ
MGRIDVVEHEDAAQTSNLDEMLAMLDREIQVGSGVRELTMKAHQSEAVENCAFIRNMGDTLMRHRIDRECTLAAYDEGILVKDARVKNSSPHLFRPLAEQLLGIVADFSSSVTDIEKDFADGTDKKRDTFRRKSHDVMQLSNERLLSAQRKLAGKVDCPKDEHNVSDERLRALVELGRVDGKVVDNYLGARDREVRRRNYAISKLEELMGQQEEQAVRAHTAEKEQHWQSASKQLALVLASAEHARPYLANNQDTAQLVHYVYQTGRDAVVAG